jgi:autotransporter-associated beta strand protein
MYVSDNAGTIFELRNETRIAFATGLQRPTGIAFGPGGSLYVAESDTGIIYKFDADGKRAVFATGLGRPFGLASDAAGNLYVADFGNGVPGGGTVVRFTPAGTGSIFAAGLYAPFAVVLDGIGNIFVSDWGAGTVYRFPLAGGKATPFAMGLARASGLATDANNNIFVAHGLQNGSKMITRYTQAGAGTLFAGGLQSPNGLAFDAPGTLYAANDASYILAFNQAGNSTVFASGFTTPGSIVFGPQSNVLPATTVKQFFQNSDLTNGNNYSPAGTPTAEHDVVLTTSAVALTLNGSNLAMRSLNQTDGSSRTISNNTASATNSTLTLGGGSNTVSPNPADLIYLGCGSCSLTLQGPNGDDGLGVLRLSYNGSAGGNFNVAEGGTLNVSAALNLGVGGGIRKTGRGTLNVSSQMSSLSTFFTINEGLVNFLPGAQTAPNIQLRVNNPNTSAGSAVVFNLQTSTVFGGIGGDVAVPSSGTNTATVNLFGTSTELQLLFRAGQGPASYAGAISGSGGVLVGGIGSHTQIFTGANSYTGLTRIGSGELVIDGTTSGQGNYVVGDPSSPGAVLSGSGTIGLSANSLVALGTFGSRLAPGRRTALGTLNVAATGAGGVSFGERGIFDVDVGANGSSDRLAITGGSINLGGSMDNLSLTSLPGGFDGSDYTIATYSQNAGGSVFNNVQGLPSDYTLQYDPTSIRVMAIQLPLQLIGAGSRKMHGSLGPFEINLLVSEPVECRASGGDHTLVFTFTNYLVSGSASVSSGQATIVGSPMLSGRTMTVNLTGVADVQKIGVTLQNVTDRFGQVLPNTTLTINMLVGDTTGNRTVSASDIGQTKAASGSATTATNFRQDVTANGAVSASDLALVKSRTGFSISAEPSPDGDAGPSWGR